MLAQIESLIRDNAQDLVINNPLIPNAQNEQVIQAASGSIAEVLKNQLDGGNIGNLISSFTGGGNESTQLINDVQQNFSGRLSELGLSNDIIKNLASSLIPLIISKVLNKDGGFDLDGLLKGFAGADGKFGLDDVVDLFSKKGGKAGSNDGGLLGGLKDLF